MFIIIVLLARPYSVLDNFIQPVAKNRLKSLNAVTSMNLIKNINSSILDCAVLVHMLAV